MGRVCEATVLQLQQKRLVCGRHAPAHGAWEVTNGLSSALREKRIDLAGAAEAGNTLIALPIVVEPVDRRRAFEDIPRLARAHGLTTYDASYLEVAVRLGDPFGNIGPGVGQGSGR